MIPLRRCGMSTTFRCGRPNATALSAQRPGQRNVAGRESVREPVSVQRRRAQHWTRYDSPPTVRQRLSAASSSAGRLVVQAQAYFDKTTGLASVENSQLEIQDWQDRLADLRSDLLSKQRQLEETTASLASVRSQLEPVSQRDPRYLGLTTKLVELLEQEDDNGRAVKVAAKAEHEAFSRLTQLIVASHGLERAYADRVKVWGLVLSIAGTLAGFLGSSVLYQRRQREMKTLIAGTDRQIAELSPRLESIDSSLSGQMGKWSDLEQRLQEMFAEQTEHQTKVLLQQRLGALMEESMSDSPISGNFSAAGGRTSPAPARHQQQQQMGISAEELTRGIAEGVTRNVSVLFAHHQAKMEAHFDDLRTQLSETQQQQPGTQQLGTAVQQSPSSTGSSSAVDPTVEQRPSLPVELFLLGFGLAVAFALHSISGLS